MSEQEAHATAQERGEILDDLLLKTSRTFALSIPLLPEPTHREVGIAYLLFRIADTLEDATEWSAERQVVELTRFGELLREPTDEKARAVAAAWCEDPPLHHDGYQELLSRIPTVMEAVSELSPEARHLVTHHNCRTIERMAAFVQRGAGADGVELEDVADLQAYCYAVAGIVGEMLTELFLLGRDELQPIAADLRKNAATFGEALQLVNILKDSLFDADEGRRFLPEDVARSEVFTLARGDLSAARDYVLRLQQAAAPRGIVEFTALPVLLARATLDRVESDGAGEKLSRTEVLEIVERMNDALDHDRPAVPLIPDSSFLLMAAIVVAAGIVRGFSGFGAGLIMVPTLSLFVDPLLAVPLVVLMEAVAGLQLVPGALRDFRLRTIAPMGIAACLAIPFGSGLLARLDATAMRIGISLVVLASVALLASGWRYRKPPTALPSTVTGLTSGLLTGSAGVGGPPVILFLLSGPDVASTTRANLICYFAITQLWALGSYVAQGLLTTTTLWHALLLTPVFLLAAHLGTRMFGRVSETLFRRLVLSFLIVIAVTGLLMALR